MPRFEVGQERERSFDSDESALEKFEKEEKCYEVKLVKREKFRFQ